MFNQRDLPGLEQLLHAKPRLDRAETLAVFAAMFRGQYHDALDVTPAARPASTVADEIAHRHIDAISIIAEGDRVALAAGSNGALNPLDGRF